MNYISEYSIDVLLNDVIKLCLRELKKNYINYYCSDKFKCEKIIGKMPSSIVTINKINTIKDVMNAEIEYFKRSSTKIIGINPMEETLNITNQIKYCTYWFIKDIFDLQTNDDTEILVNKIIEILEKNGKL